MSPVLEVAGLTKIFKTRGGGEFTAVDGVSFDVQEGEIVGLLGPNGAGKTTTIQMLLGLTSVTSGSISYFGKSFFAHKAAILKRINFASGYTALPWRLTVWENLDVFGWLYETPNHRHKIKELAHAFESEDLLGQKFQSLSAGQRTRVILIKAFMNDPEVLLLDEPTASLDPDIAAKIRQYIVSQRQQRNMTLLITSHNMGEVEELCDRVVFLNKGKIYAIDTPEGLARRNKTSQLQLMVTDGLKRLIELTEKQKFSYTETKRFITITLPEDSIAPFLTEVGKKGVSYSEIEIIRPSLEDFFLSVGRGEKV